MNKETDIIIRTPVGNTDNIQVKEVVKQGTILGPIMCCADTYAVNSIGEEVKYSSGKINIRMQYLWMTQQQQVKQNTSRKV